MRLFKKLLETASLKLSKPFYIDGFSKPLKIFKMSLPIEFNVDAILSLTHLAGEKILRIYSQDFEVYEKPNVSPLTEADLLSHKTIIDGPVGKMTIDLYPFRLNYFLKFDFLKYD